MASLFERFNRRTERKEKTAHRDEEPRTKTAEQLKEDGNKAYQKGQFAAAVDAYSQAITINPSVATYYTNRALARLQLKQWDSVSSDCYHALNIDKANTKAYYFAGRALLHLRQYEEAIRMLTMAQDLAHNSKSNYGDEIASQIRSVRREKFRAEEDRRIQQEIEMQSYINNLIDKDMEEALQRLKKPSAAEDEEDDEEEKKGRESAANFAIKQAEDYKTQLNGLFAQVDERRRRREVPDYLCGKISFELMRDPVITPSGITYDRSDIREHLQRVGHFDPVTRAPLTENQLIPNLAMKEVIEQFIQENPWALEELD